jgi:hypothetical protein
MEGILVNERCSAVKYRTVLERAKFAILGPLGGHNGVYSTSSPLQVSRRIYRRSRYGKMGKQRLDKVSEIWFPKRILDG